MTSDAADNASILTSRDRAVEIIRFNRPDRLNAADEEMVAGLHAAIDNAASDSAVRAVVLIGSERSFMAGIDLTLFQQNLDDAPAMAARLIDQFHGMIRAIRSLPKPVVGALSGSVAGGGFGVALACDLCVMADNARLISAYSKLGTNPDAGTTWGITQLVGRRRALDIMWLNDPIDAQQALAWGLANKVVPAAKLESETLALAQRLAEGAPATMGRIKQLADQACISDLDAQLDREKAAFVAAAQSPEFREAITAFFERRPPRF